MSEDKCVVKLNIDVIGLSAVADVAHLLNEDRTIRDRITKSDRYFLKLKSPVGEFTAEMTKKDWDTHLPTFRSVDYVEECTESITLKGVQRVSLVPFFSWLTEVGKQNIASKQELSEAFEAGRKSVLSIIREGPSSTIADWVKDAGRCARDHGFHEEGANSTAPAWCANLHGEVSEFWEAYRRGKLNEPCDKPIALTCAEEELADIAIRTFDIAFQMGIDLEKAIEVKHKYNIQRPRRNGGKHA